MNKLKIKELQFDNNVCNTILKNTRKYHKEKDITLERLAEMVDLSHDFIRHLLTILLKV